MEAFVDIHHRPPPGPSMFLRSNPLAVIAGRAQLFLREETDPERRRALALINSQARRVYEMIADMMLFARPPKPEPERIDLVELVDQQMLTFFLGFTQTCRDSQLLPFDMFGCELSTVLNIHRAGGIFAKSHPDIHSFELAK